MDASETTAYFASQYPDKNVVKLPADDPTEIICEVMPTVDHPEYSVAIAAIRESAPHVHHVSTEQYEALQGTTQLVVEDRPITLHEGEAYTVEPGQVHYAKSNEGFSLVKVTSQPGWTLGDHTLIDLVPIGKSQNGIDVLYDPVYSHAATHLEDTPDLKDLVSEVISALELNGQEIKAHFDMGRIVGTDNMIDVDGTDEIVYGARKNRLHEGLVPFVKNREPQPCPYVTVLLVPKADATYVLLSAWIGVYDEENDEPFPQSPDATPQSAEFWSKHAFVYGSQEIIAGTETAERPW